MPFPRMVWWKDKGVLNAGGMAKCPHDRIAAQ